MHINGVGTRARQPETSGVKRTVKAATVAAGGLATIALLTRAGKFDKVAENVGNPVVNKGKDFLRKIGDFILNKTESIFKAVKTKVTPFADTVAEKAKGFFAKVADKLNFGKFNPDLASVASKSAETFNNFVK